MENLIKHGGKFKDHKGFEKKINNSVEYLCTPEFTIYFGWTDRGTVLTSTLPGSGTTGTT